MVLRTIYKKWSSLILAVLGLLIALATLYHGDDIGLSDNGDFDRVMNTCSLSFCDEIPCFIYVDSFSINLSDDDAISNACRIMFSGDNWENYPSIQVPIVRISVVINLFINHITGGDMTQYRLGVLGTMYCLIYAFLLFVMFRQIQLKSNIADMALKVIILIIVCDVAYISYFNSLYGEPVQILAFLLCIIAGLRLFRKDKPTIPDGILCFASVLLYGWAKFINIPAALLICICFCIIFIVKTRSKTTIVMAAGVVIIFVGIYSSIPKWMDSDTNFNSVFFGVLKDADEAEAMMYLEDLGLPEGMIEYADTNYYVRSVPKSFAEAGYDEIFSQISKGDILGLYLKYPELLLKKINIAIQNSGFIRPYYLSNFDSSYPRLTFSDDFSLWSNIRAQAGFDTMYGNVFIFVAFAFIALLRFRKRRDMALPTLVITVLCLLMYTSIVQIVANGEGDIAKHMFSYVQIIDFLVLFIVGSALSTVGEGNSRLYLTAAVMTAVVLAISPVSGSIRQIVLSHTSHSQIETGAYVSFGSYNGESLTWLVTKTYDDRAELICVSEVEDTVFSNNNSGYWIDSDLRSWLNGEFLEGFSGDEKQALVETDNTVLLSVDTMELADSGDRDFYTFHIPLLAARGYDRAYKTYVTDTVTLPDIDLIYRLADEGHSIKLDTGYWLETPYYNNGNMVRYIAEDGYVYMRDACVKCGVRPVLYISSDIIVSGAGSQSSPLDIQYT